MSVKLAGTLKPMNDSFPVAEGVDIDVEINGAPKRLQKAIEDGDIGGGGGSSIQYEEMPVPTEELSGKIVQFVGNTGTYLNGRFYKCVPGEGDSWKWELIEDDISDNPVIFELPEAESEPSIGDKLSVIIGKFIKMFNRSLMMRTPHRLSRHGLPKRQVNLSKQLVTAWEICPH